MYRNTISQTYYIRAPVTKVFDALTNPKMLSRWFLKSAALDQKKGGKYSFTPFAHDDNDERGGNVLEFRKNEKLVIDWPWAEDTKVTFITKKTGNNTLLRIIHSGFKDQESKLGHLAGWTYYLTNLKSVIENKKDLRSTRDVIFRG